MIPKDTCTTKTAAARRPGLFTTRTMVKIALLGALSFGLMMLEFPLPFFPSFLQLDFSDVPALLGGFALGPWAGLFVILIKNLLHMLVKGPVIGGVGQLANFIVGAALVVPAALLYRFKRSRSGAVAGMGLGILSMLAVASLANYFVLIPLYSLLLPLEQIIAISAAAIPAITGTGTYVLYGVVPFNLMKALLETVLALLLYKRLSPLLHR